MLTVITGPMFAGKTSKLLSMLKAHKIAGHSTLVFKPSNDKRYADSEIVAHDGESMDAINIDCRNTFYEYLEAVYKDRRGESEYLDVIAFDEAQFFDDSLIDAVEDAMRWTHTIVAGLKEDYMLRNFGAMPTLLSRADNIICLKAVCSKCKKINSATRTFRKNGSKEQVLVGGVETYEPRCLECWL